MTPSALRVLVVDDDASARSALRTLLKTQNYEVDEAGDGVVALQRLAEIPPDIVVTDLDMPRMNGIQLLTKLRQRDRGLPVIVVTAANKERGKSSDNASMRDTQTRVPAEYAAT